ncbi:MAG: ribose-phosphate pyrophosphokinase-like domain-containing protein [Candidatus Omnitrophica bacterium]|nr:ribose-phosphate pyrophosphokinase-like domain-containing protein [Candidatus Omnitrophota bacterium]
MLIYLLGIFADMVGFLEKSSGKIKGIDVSLSPPFSKLSGPIHIDYVTYIQQRFKNDAEEAVKRIQDAQVSSLSINKISSGHWRINIPSNLRGKNIVLIHSTESSKNILELLLMLSYLRKVGVKTISLINTYQGYARQDKVFTPGQGVTAHILLTALNHFLDHNFSVNAHYAERTGPAFLGPEIWIEKQGLRETIQTLYPQGVYNLNGFVQVTEKLMEIVKKEKGDEEFRHYPLLLISPDDGAFSYVKETAEVLKTRYGIEATTGYLNKIRISPTKVEISGPLLGEGGKSLNLSFPLSHYWIFILDDETSTGGTLKVGTYHLVKVLGADGNKIYSGVVHGKFPKDKEKFYNLKEKELLPQIIIALDTLPLPEGIPYASCGPLISFAIKRILGN